MTQPDLSSILLGTDDEKESDFIKLGFDDIDKSIKGLRPSNTYTLAGLEKSGKTSLLLNWVSHMLRNKKNIHMLSTEMTYKEVVKRMATVRGIKINFNQDKKRKRLYAEIKENFTFYGADKLSDGVGLSVKQTEGIAHHAILKGADLIIVDNLTTFMNQKSKDNNASQFKIGAALNKMINLSKLSGVPILTVLHIKPSTTFNETPEGIFQLVKDGEIDKIFQESASVVKKPSLNDVYGGGGILSQVAGTFLIWRPMQKFAQSNIKGEAMVILDSMRHSESGLTFRYTFEGNTGRFISQKKETEETVSNLQDLFDEEEKRT